MTRALIVDVMFLVGTLLWSRSVSGQELMLDWLREPGPGVLDEVIVVEWEAVHAVTTYALTTEGALQYSYYATRYAGDGSVLIDRVPVEELFDYSSSVIVTGLAEAVVYSPAAPCASEVQTLPSWRCQEIAKIYNVDGRLDRVLNAAFSDTAGIEYMLGSGAQGQIMVIYTMGGSADFDLDGSADLDVGSAEAAVAVLYDRDGSVEWHAILEEAAPCCFSHPIFATDGGFYVGHALPPSGAEPVLFRLSSEGDVSWTKEMDYGDRFRGAPTSDGGLLLISKPDSGLYRLTEHVTRLDPSGDVRDHAVLAPISDASCVFVTDLAVDAHDNLLVAARFLGSVDLDADGEPDVEARNRGDCLEGPHSALVAGYDAGGGLRFADAFGWSFKPGSPITVHPVNDESFVLAGYVPGPVDLDNDGFAEAFVGTGLHQNFVARYRVVPTTGTENESPPGDVALSVFPNPASGPVTFVLDTAKHVSIRIEIFDPLGRAVTTLANASVDAGVHHFVLNSDELPAGVFFYRAAIDGVFVGGSLVLVR